MGVGHPCLLSQTLVDRRILLLKPLVWDLEELSSIPASATGFLCQATSPLAAPVPHLQDGEDGTSLHHSAAVREFTARRECHMSSLTS